MPESNEKLARRIEIEYAQKHNWDKQEQHWQELQSHNAIQRKHWKYIVMLGFIAVTVNGLAAFFAPIK